MIKIVLLLSISQAVVSYKISVALKMESTFEIDGDDYGSFHLSGRKVENKVSHKNKDEKDIHQDVDRIPCPDGVPTPMCLENPCNNATCHAFPDAKCEPFLCGGCNYLFFNSSNKLVECNQNCPNIITNGNGKCKNGNYPNYDCKNIIWCSIKRCSQHTSAHCCVDYCQDCQLNYYDNEGHKLPIEGCEENSNSTIIEP